MAPALYFLPPPGTTDPRGKATASKDTLEVSAWDPSVGFVVNDDNLLHKLPAKSMSITRSRGQHESKNCECLGDTLLPFKIHI